MSLEYTPDDFVLNIQDDSDQTNEIVGKYEAFLEAITTEDFGHVRKAIRAYIRFMVSEKYPSTRSLAEENWDDNPKLYLRYNELEEYLSQFELLNLKAGSIDLATGTGKSWVIYGVAAIALAEGLVDKVLVLCPSLTIEEGLKQKFEQLSGNQDNQQIMQELGAIHSSPSIKSANDPILAGDICVENIHAVYKRTGSSIEDSFKGKGERTLVISDEAHHIYSPDETATKKWLSFLQNKAYNFGYHLGVTGTPYIGNDYFPDVVYRYGIRQAIEDGVVKKIDYKLEEADKEKGWDETWHNHISIREKYAGQLKPISIVVTDRIYRTVELSRELCEYIVEKENISFEEASKKVIWVASGLPSGKNEKEVVESIYEHPEKVRKKNISQLKTVDEEDNPVEWIISVAMLTEGWDVKNVFQIVPHEKRAFNSKLLISQVLGRGLRIPKGLEQPAVRVNNHEKWSDEIKYLYEEVLELENRATYNYSETYAEYDFPLYNLLYDNEEKIVTSTKQSPYGEPKIEKLRPQNKQKKTSSIYSESGSISYSYEIPDNKPLEEAAREIKLFLKRKDLQISKKWPLSEIKRLMKKKLENLGYDSSFVSRENLATYKQAFGPMFRDEDKEVKRLKRKADDIEKIKLSSLPKESFSESSLKRDGYLFYSNERLKELNTKSKAILKDYIDNKNKVKDGGLSEIKRVAQEYGGNFDDVEFLGKNLVEVKDKNLKTPREVVYVSHNPEKLFVEAIITNSELISGFIKSPDIGFYSLPYSYKPAGSGSSHVQSKRFNPDFFIKLKDKNIILVVEIKATEDNTPKNRAKNRDGTAHFKDLNETLNKEGINWKYYFYFLSERNYTDFFQAVRECQFEWKSELMQDLEKNE